MKNRWDSYGKEFNTYLTLSLLADFLAVSGYCPLDTLLIGWPPELRLSSSSPTLVTLPGGLLLEEAVVGVLIPTTVTFPEVARRDEPDGRRSEVGVVTWSKVWILCWSESCWSSPPPPPPPRVPGVLWRADWELLNSDAEVTYMGLPVAASINPFNSDVSPPLPDGTSLSWNQTENSFCQ
jgi:hypothetical protein